MRFLSVPLALGVAYCISFAGAAPSPAEPRAITFSSIRDLTLEEQREALGRITKDAQFTIWEDRLKTYRDENLDTLEHPQVDALNGAIHLANTRNLTAEPLVRESMADAFGKDMASDLITTLGGKPGKPAKLTQRVPACECAQRSDFCWGAARCKPILEESCQVAAPGGETCGLFGMWGCTGMCG